MRKDDTGEFGRQIVQGLREAVAFSKGRDAGLRLHRLNACDAIDVRAIRQRTGLSQAQFALQFGFNVETLKGWEQGRRSPTGAARVLLTLIEIIPDQIQDALNKAA